ncbi:hypothetical protein [Orenia marismortui]|uniref:Uncharacterized protein n=1 Tax=Orenia marismortui TaxID=46469 RepID=A0A4R8H6Q8_9FIRM|nr:hypothetical protein [Orenia marismortui]TDX53266.1 hypothetical protein C7959_103118 [Orenia marismortui]
MTDASGKVVMDQDYLPFDGDLARPNQIEVQNDTGESYKYTAQKQVVSIGLYYYGGDTMILKLVGLRERIVIVGSWMIRRVRMCIFM